MKNALTSVYTRIAAVALASALASSAALAMGMKNAPCDDWTDCFYTVAWYIFWR